MKHSVIKDRDANQVGGGVMLLVKDCWNVLECEEFNDLEDIEMYGVQLTCSTHLFGFSIAPFVYG